VVLLGTATWWRGLLRSNSLCPHTHAGIRSKSRFHQHVRDRRSGTKIGRNFCSIFGTVRQHGFGTGTNLCAKPAPMHQLDGGGNGCGRSGCGRNGEAAYKRDSVDRPKSTRQPSIFATYPRMRRRNGTNGPFISSARSCSGWGLPSQPRRRDYWCALTAPFQPYL